MADAESFLDRVRHHSPTSSQIIGFLALLTTGGIALLFGGLTVTGIVIALIILTPIFIFFSPILIPIAIVLFLGVAGLLTAAGAAVAVVSVVTWLYKYFKGRQPVGSEQFDRVRQRAFNTVEQGRHKAREYGSQVQSKVQSAAPGA